jgi:hypothetical protein
MSVHPSGSGLDRISMCLHLEDWRQTDTKAPPPIPPTAALFKAPPTCLAALGPRHDGLCWETPPGAHVAQRPPKGPRWARRCGEACRCAGGCWSSSCCGGIRSCSRGSTVHGERHYCWQCFGPERASEPTAAPSPEAPDGAQPGVQGECPDLFQQRPIPRIPAPRIGITPGSMGWIPALNIECSRSQTL